MNFRQILIVICAKSLHGSGISSPPWEAPFTLFSSMKKAKTICETSIASLRRAKSSSLSVEKEGESNNLYVAIKFAQITREYHVRFFTGLPEPKVFCDIFNMLQRKVLLIQYGTGKKQPIVKAKEKSEEYLIWANWIRISTWKRGKDDLGLWS